MGDDRGPRLLAALSVPREQPDAGPQTREPDGRRESEARGRTGDERDAAVHALEVGGVPAAAPEVVAEVGVAGQHCRVEEAVEEVRVGHWFGYCTSFIQNLYSLSDDRFRTTPPHRRAEPPHGCEHGAAAGLGAPLRAAAPNPLVRRLSPLRGR